MSRTSSIVRADAAPVTNGALSAARVRLAGSSVPHARGRREPVAQPSADLRPASSNRIPSPATSIALESLRRISRWRVRRPASHSSSWSDNMTNSYEAAASRPRTTLLAMRVFRFEVFEPSARVGSNGDRRGPGHVPQDVSSPVRRSVVDDEHDCREEILTEDGLALQAQEALAVMRDHHRCGVGCDCQGHDSAATFPTAHSADVSATRTGLVTNSAAEATLLRAASRGLNDPTSSVESDNSHDTTAWRVVKSPTGSRATVPKASTPHKFPATERHLRLGGLNPSRRAREPRWFTRSEAHRQRGSLWPT